MATTTRAATRRTDDRVVKVVKPCLALLTPVISFISLPCDPQFTDSSSRELRGPIIIKRLSRYIATRCYINAKANVQYICSP